MIEEKVMVGKRPYLYRLRHNLGLTAVSFFYRIPVGPICWIIWRVGVGG